MDRTQHQDSYLYCKAQRINWRFDSSTQVHLRTDATKSVVSDVGAKVRLVYENLTDEKSRKKKKQSHRQARVNRIF